MNVRVTVTRLVDDIIGQLTLENEKARAQYAQEKAFADSERTRVEAGKIEDYGIPEPQPRKLAVVTDREKLIAALMEPFDAILNSSGEDSPGTFPGIELRDFPASSEDQGTPEAIPVNASGTVVEQDALPTAKSAQPSKELREAQATAARKSTEAATEAGEEKATARTTVSPGKRR